MHPVSNQSESIYFLEHSDWLKYVSLCKAAFYFRTRDGGGGRDRFEIV